MTTNTNWSLPSARLRIWLSLSFRRSFNDYFLGFLTVLFICIVIQPAAAQKANPKEYALLFGTVFSAQGTLVPGVPVKIRRADQKKAKWELVSDRMGEFAQRVPPGKADYVVYADIKTPKGESKPEVTVHIENDERIDFSLHLKD